jgi:hypothetical protein
LAKKGKNWRNFEEDGDRYDRVSRMKPRERKSSKAADLDEEFEVSESEWKEAFPEGFAARVVEVHKRYAFVSPEPAEGDIKTRDVWLATIARKFLQAKRDGTFKPDLRIRSSMRGAPSSLIRYGADCKGFENVAYMTHR